MALIFLFISLLSGTVALFTLRHILRMRRIKKMAQNPHSGITEALIKKASNYSWFRFILQVAIVMGATILAMWAWPL